MNESQPQRNWSKAGIFIWMAFLFVFGDISGWLYASGTDNGRSQPAIPSPILSSQDEAPGVVQSANCVQNYAYKVYFPVAIVSSTGYSPPSPLPLPPPIPMTGTPPIDFASVRANLRANGFDLAFNKVGFHVGPKGITGLDTNWWKKLDAACVPVFLKSVDSAGQLWEVQEQMKISGVGHTLVYRRSVPYAGAASGVDPDVPNYNLDPAAGAQEHWQWHKAGFPQELDPAYVWFETINEVDKNKAEWLGQFALEMAKLTMADGYKWAAFGWSAGEPEPEHWETPSMLAFLRLAGENPDKLAIALHEYSYVTADIGNLYPYLIGRLQTLFDVCDKHGIPRPTVMITEWGWTYDSIFDPNNPDPVGKAMSDIQWAAWLYAAYPEVKGAALWYLGPGFSGISNQAQQLITPLGDYSLSNYFAVTPGQGAIDASLFQP